MAKMEFYNLEEVASRLGVDEEQIKQMASRGELQPFRDRDRLLFKRAQVDALAARDASATGIPLSSDSTADEISLADSGETGIIRLDDSNDTGLTPLQPSDSQDTGSIQLAETGMGDTGEINLMAGDDTGSMPLSASDGSTGIPLSSIGLSDPSSTGLSAMDDSGIGLSGTKMGDTGLSGTDLGGTGLEVNSGSGLDLNSAGSGIDLSGSLGGTDIPLSEADGSTSDLTLSGTGTGLDSTGANQSEGSTGLGMALDDIGGSALENAGDSQFGHTTDTHESPTSSGGDTKQTTGISVFDAGEVEEADAMEQTLISEAGGVDEDLSLESVGSGSGLLDLTRESDDTSLGAELLDEIYPTGSNAGSAVADTQMDTAAGSSGVFDGGVTLEAEETDASASMENESISAFESAPAEAQEEPLEAAMTTDPGPVGMAVAVLEPFDPAANGFSAGMLIGATVSLVLVLIITISTLFGGTSVLVTTFAKDAGTLGTYVGILAAISVVFGIAGLFVGKWLNK